MTRRGLKLLARAVMAFTLATAVAPSLAVPATRAVGTDTAYSISRGNSSQFGGQVAIYHPASPMQVIVVDGPTPSLAIKAGTDTDIAGAQGFILRLFPANGGTLAVGTYANAHVEDDPPLTPRIGITAGYDLCVGTAPGWFRIDELELSGTDVTKLSATAVCQYSDAWTALEVRFHSTVPIGAMGLATNEVVFPRTHTDTPSDPIAVVVTAAGPSDLHPGAAAVAGPDAADFEVAADGCDGASLAPGDTCEIDVRFRPLDGDAMDRHAWLEIPDDSVGGVGRSFMTGTIERSTTIAIVSSANPNPKPGSTKFSATMTPRADYGTIEWSIDGQLVTTQGTGMPFNVVNRAGTYAVSARYLGFEGFSASGESNVIQQVTYAASSVRFVVRPAVSGTPGAVDVTAIVATPPLDVDGTLTITDASTGDLVESGPVSKDVPYVHREDLMFDGLHLLHAEYSGLAPWIPPAEASIAVEGTTGIDPTNATHFFLGGLGSARTSGVPGTVTVIALDARGRIDDGYTGTVHVTSTDPAAVLPANITFASGDAGRRIVPVKLATNGQRSVTATDVSSPSITGTTSVTVSAPVVGPLSASSVSVGFQHSCAVVADKTVRCWGRNPNGLLGDGTTVNRTSPVTVVGVSNVTTVGAGGDHTCALLVDRTVSCWGANSKGQLGDGTLEPRAGAVKVVGLTDVVALDVEASTTCAVRSDHVALCWGYALDMKTQRADPVPIPMIDHVTHMTFAGDAACAIATDHTVKCWGANQFGQLGNGTIDTLLYPTPTPVPGITSATSLTMGGEHVCALLADSTVRCWGAGARGETGDGGFLDRDHPVAVTGLTGVVSISGVGRSTCARLSNGTARCWGANDFGQLGDGTAIDRATPVAVPLGGTALSVSAGYPGGCAALQAGGVACWGLNDSSQIGDGPVNQLVPAATRTLPTVSALAAYGAGTCALLASGTVQCWGSRATGELANDVGTASPVPVAIDVDEVVQIDAGDTHACARRSDGSIVCWGGAFYGQLGNGVRSTWSPTVTVTGITNAVDVSAGYAHSCAVLATGAVACWGALNGIYGNFVTTPELVDGVTDAVSVAVGEGFTCARRATGSVACWGVNGNGQLGRGTATNQEPTPENVSGLTDAIAIIALRQDACALRATHEVVCWGINDSGQHGDGTANGHRTPVAVAGLTHAVAIAGGFKHACALLDTGGVRCWGANASGQLGDGTVLRRTSPVAVGGLTATAITAGDAHTCAVTAGAVRCWGSDTAGQLGRGRHPYAPNPVAGSLVGLPGLVAVLDTSASSATLTIPIAIGVLPGGPPVSGYFVSESATTPKSTAAWIATPPAFFALPPGNSERTLYAWIRSDTGEVSPAAPASIVLDLVQPTAQLSMPATTRSRNVAVTAGGTDEGTGIGAWLVTESPVIPTSGDARWSSKRPTSMTLSSGDGTKHVYLWTRDRVRNVSIPATRNVRLDTKAPAGAQAPGRPAFGTGSARSKVPVRLRWAAATDASHAVHYQLEYQKKGSAAYHRVSLADASAASATVPLAGGTYRFRVRALDAAGNASGWKLGGWSTAKAIQEGASAVKLSKGFHRVASSTASGGAVASATSAGSTATIRIVGRAIAWVGMRGPDRGIAAVWVDGKLGATIDLYAAGSQTAQVIWQASLKPKVTHVVRIVAGGTHGPTSGGTRVDVDAFLVSS